MRNIEWDYACGDGAGRALLFLLAARVPEEYLPYAPAMDRLMLWLLDEHRDAVAASDATAVAPSSPSVGADAGECPWMRIAELELELGALRTALGHAPSMPEGVEWPRFEDGGLVRFGDGIGEHHCDDCSEIVFRDGSFDIFDGNGEGYEFAYGERVRRP